MPDPLWRAYLKCRCKRFIVEAWTATGAPCYLSGEFLRFRPREDPAMGERVRRVVAYARTSDPDAPSWLRQRAYAASLSTIGSWAQASGASVVAVAVEGTPDGLSGASARAGFLRALSLVRDGEADAVCVASLQELDPDLVVQEMFLAEARDAHVAFLSASPADASALLDVPHDPTRALVRRVIVEWPRFQGEMRSLRAGVRRSLALEGFDALAPALADLEARQEYGGGIDGMRGGRSHHRMVGRLRAFRARAARDI